MVKVFISYSWEDKEHKEWVWSLTNKLLENGIDATLDQYDLVPGDRIPQFMEQSVATADYVLVICTPTYKEKSDRRQGGVGYEENIISGEILEQGNERKFIPIIRKGTVQTSIPNCLKGKLYITLSDNEQYDENFETLIRTLKGISIKPIVKEVKETANVDSHKKTDITSNEPIHILKIIKEGVTSPKMDGTRGSALYKIPFKLSRKPSLLWKECFIKAWNHPPVYTTMHRPGIASIHGDEICLDGTTMEEVRDYHQKTLCICVDIANKEEKEILDKIQQQKQKEESQKNEYLKNAFKLAEDIKF